MLRNTTCRLLFLICLGCSFAGELHAQGVDERQYLIGPEDVLDISVWKEETLQKEVLVRPDGNISFPLIGDLHAAGKSPSQLQVQITKMLKNFMPEPVVTVLVTKVAGYKIYVIGQVAKSGQFQVGRYLDVIQALALAGGLTPYASENHIFVLRRKGDKDIVIPFEYAAIKKGQKLQQNITLQSDDVVVVP